MAAEQLVGLAGAKGYIVDLDGTLVHGRRAIAGAAELLALIAGRFVVLSNNSTHQCGTLARELAASGLPVSAGDIVLAGAAAVELLARESPGARVMMLAGRELQALARELGLRPVAERPDIVLLARDLRFSYARLRRAANAVRAGAALVAANPDATHPGRDGRLVPETGALLAALRCCAGDVPARIVGKPEPELFLEALRRLGTRPQETTVIGDNPLTDGEGARRLGMRFVLAAELLAECRRLPAAEAGPASAARAARGQYRLSDSTSNVRRMVSTEAS